MLTEYRHILKKVKVEDENIYFEVNCGKIICQFLDFKIH